MPKWRLRSLAGERRMEVALLPRRPRSEAEGFSKRVFSWEERVEEDVVVVVVVDDGDGDDAVVVVPVRLRRPDRVQVIK